MESNSDICVIQITEIIFGYACFLNRNIASLYVAPCRALKVIQ